MPNRYECRVVPFIGQVKGAVINAENAARVSAQLQQVIADNALQGWEFYSVEKINIAVQPGCLGALGGAKAGIIQFDQVIFRREIQDR